MSDVWQAAAARDRFSELPDSAIEGRPQFVRCRDGREVVVVSKDYYERTKPNLKTVLLALRFGNRGDDFDTVMDDARGSLAGSLRPNASPQENKGDGHPGPKPPAQASTVES